MSKILEAADQMTVELAAALREIHERLERLEAQRGETSANTAKCRHSGSSGLMERVEAAIELSWGTDTETWTPEARAAIRAVAEWLEDEYPDRSGSTPLGYTRIDYSGKYVADTLRAELKRGR